MMRVALITVAFLISSFILPLLPTAKAATTSSISIDELSYRSIDGNALQNPYIGQQIFLALTIQNNDSDQFDYIAIFDIRDGDGVTTDIVEKEGRIDSEGLSTVQVPWMSDVEGSFTVRAFLVENNPELVILSHIKSAPLTVTAFEEKIVNVPPIVEEPTQEEEQVEPASDEGPAKYTIMIYMVASDLESEGYAATYDIMEMMEADIGQGVNVIVQTGGSANSTLDETRFIDFTTVQRHEIKGEDRITVMDLGQQNMGDYRTLSDFMSWSYSEYPAEKYAIILWDHGNGIRGFGYDDIHEDVLTIKELQDAFSRSKKVMGTNFEIIGFDACLMATLEVALRLSNYANYMVASEEVEPGWGWDYTAFLSSLGTSSQSMYGEEIGRVIADSYVEHSKENSEIGGYDADRTITLSVIDLSKVADISKNVKALGERLETQVKYSGGLENAQTFARVVQNTERYGTDFDGSAGYTDLYELVGNVDGSFAGVRVLVDSIQSSIDEAVIYNVRGEAKPNAHGLSIFLQLDEYETGEEYLSYLVTEWLRLIESSADQLATDDEAPSGAIDYSDGVIEGQIGDDDISYGAVSFYRESEGSKYEVVSYYALDPSEFLDESGSVEYELDEGTISLCNEDFCAPVFVLLENYDDIQFAYFPVRLESADGYYNERVTLIYEIDEGDFIFLGAWEGVQDETAQRELRPIEVGDKIYTYTYEYDEDDYDYFAEVEYEQLDVTENFGPEYTDYGEDYTFQMEICDFAGNCGISEVFEM